MINVYTYGAIRMSPLQKAFAVPFVALFYSLFYLWYGGPVLHEVRERLNAPQILPGYTSTNNEEGQGDRNGGSGIGTIPRLYVYSEKDKLTPVSEVQSHVALAREAGFDVRTLVFEDAPHVASAKVDPVRYWGAVDEVWRDAMSKVRVKAKL